MNSDTDTFVENKLGEILTFLPSEDRHFWIERLRKTLQEAIAEGERIGAERSFQQYHSTTAKDVIEMLRSAKAAEREAILAALPDTRSGSFRDDNSMAFADGQNDMLGEIRTLITNRTTIEV